MVFVLVDYVYLYSYLFVLFVYSLVYLAQHFYIMFYSTIVGNY